MYLKSLVLKGFKSFADKSALSLEPGITAIVGPNGSGKSNISDAVLWVLGERSARNLRGQAMEDIIFAGSAARKAVSMAEVELVLDNSDGTLPIDFDEVSVARRMYRSGESEYLVNGVVARRVDVLDILHDTGLGTGTHSIISQGSLDSILQSKPEDRRALIEEAAGVLKHKQRKEKSARKLERMDNHLARVRDVAAELERQLGPLERKAKRAQAYAVASEQLAEVKLALAVDDLRKLQGEWDNVCATEKAISTEVATRREGVDAAERKVNDMQELVRRETVDAGELAKQASRASRLMERLDSSEMLMRERRRTAQSSQADLQIALDGAAERRTAAEAELAVAQSQFEEVLAASKEADARVEELSKQRYEAAERRRAAEGAVRELQDSLKQCNRDLDQAKKRQSSLQDALSSGMAREQLVQARKQELEGDLERARTEHEEAVRIAKEAREKLEKIESLEHEAREALSTTFNAREDAHAQRDAVREAVRMHEAEKKAIEQAQRASREDDPALEWLVENAERFGGTLSPVSKVIKAPVGLESLLESLLGSDIAALAVGDQERARAIAAALAEGRLPGDVSLIMDGSDRIGKSNEARSCTAGVALVDEVGFTEDTRHIVETLFGDVVLCDDRDAAFAGHAADDAGLRFVSRDGCVIWPSGKVRIFGTRDDADEGVLARERRLEDIEAALGRESERLKEAEKQAEETDRAYQAAQTSSLKLSQDLASQKGACQSTAADEERTSHKLGLATRELESVEQQVLSARKTLEDLQPDVDAVAASVEELEARRDELTRGVDEGQDAVEPLRSEAAALSEKLNEARLSAATYVERKTYSERLAAARRRDIADIDETVAESRRALLVKQAAVDRAAPVLDVISTIASGLQRRSRLLDDAVSASENATSNVHANAAAARDEARKAHDAYDEASARMAQVQVEKSRLEVRVEAAVTAVVRDCATPLDRAQELPQLEDRRAAEDEAFRLERRIKNMGAINPDAAEEYEQLKTRYDFFAGQLSDMEAARRSLGRIVRVIDARMKDDFARTYEEVNENFKEIFALLFPGGSGSLSLDDPDDLENTGVEVTAQPRGKRLTKMMLMSGGEKSLTALALLFAVYKTRSTPFYILDEVEAALDDTNLRRLTSYIDTLRKSTQLIMITHQRRTMEMADVLFGVSMQADGVTKVISQKLERALEQAE